MNWQDDEYDDYDPCDECKSLGDDYYVNENDEVVCACDNCPNNNLRWDDD